ncbi:hypothetical protein CN378_03310 [Bacillus sp. AFS015802]|uniref:hypothetical protein n=1 Tax=Bacillus sp. AFS015802 TaxID=2033486 RepID=UPI000BF4EAD0|nr:hypothetical protein [Bacillus sp. AFS015802]PFA69810.1 hypothetical protein CN378_03310 [Bacillus sp. AFS015802]
MKKFFPIGIITGALILGLATSSFASPSNKLEMENYSPSKLSDDNSIELKMNREKESKEIEADVIVNSKNLTLNSLKKYQKKMPSYFKKLKSEGYASVPATITFNETISFAKFEEIMNDSKVDINRIFVRTKSMSDGSLGALTIAVEDNVVNSEKLKSILNGPVELEVVGVYAAEGSIKTKEKTFETLTENNNIFLVDVSKQVIENQITSSKEFKNDKTKDKKLHIDVNVYDIFWELQQVK